MTDTEICALTDKQSIQQVIDHFRPAIRTVLQEIDMCPDWDTSSLADTLGISRQDMTDILEGKHTQNVLPCILRILASLNWAISHSTLFSGERKYILPYHNGTAKLEFFNDSKNIKNFMPSDFQIAPFEILKIHINVTLHVSQMVDFVQNEKCKNVIFTLPPTQPP